MSNNYLVQEIMLTGRGKTARCVTGYCYVLKEKLTYLKSLLKRCDACGKRRPFRRMIECHECDLVYHRRCGEKIRRIINDVVDTGVREVHTAARQQVPVSAANKTANPTPTMTTATTATLAQAIPARTPTTSCDGMRVIESTDDVDGKGVCDVHTAARQQVPVSAANKTANPTPTMTTATTATLARAIITPNVEITALAYGSERISRDGMKLDFEEIKVVQFHEHGLTKPANDTHFTDESGGHVPQLPETIEANREITSSIPSEILNSYTIGDRLGEGNFAVVYRCHDIQLNTDYALKVIKKTDSPFMSEMIDNELSILRTINQHPNIIRLVSDIVTPTHMYLITELVSGGDLCEAVARGTDFPQNDIRLMTKKLASALAYLHAMNIVHKDVKPNNILIEIDSDGHLSQLKLADFGLSEIVTETQYDLCGTPSYVSPEMLNCEGYDAKIDVWAAGVTLYELLCSFPPFSGKDKDNEELFENIRSGEYDFPAPHWDHVPDEAKNLVRSMLEYNPSMRFSAEDVLGHPWLDDYDDEWSLE